MCELIKLILLMKMETKNHWDPMTRANALNQGFNDFNGTNTVNYNTCTYMIKNMLKRRKESGAYLATIFFIILPFQVFLLY